MAPETKRKYWYRIDNYGCPVCAGQGPIYRERVYTEAEAGTFYIDEWDYCEL